MESYIIWGCQRRHLREADIKKKSEGNKRVGTWRKRIPEP